MRLTKTGILSNISGVESVEPSSTTTILYGLMDWFRIDSIVFLMCFSSFLAIMTALYFGILPPPTNLSHDVDNPGFATLQDLKQFYQNLSHDVDNPSLLHNLDSRHEIYPTFDWIRRVMQQTR